MSNAEIYLLTDDDTVACCRRYNADNKIISGTGALYALLAVWGLMLPLTAGTRPVIGGAHGMVPAFQIASVIFLRVIMLLRMSREAEPVHWTCLPI